MLDIIRNQGEEEGKAVPAKEGPSDRAAWQKALRAMKKDPKLLMDSVPSVWEE